MYVSQTLLGAKLLAHMIYIARITYAACMQESKKQRTLCKVWFMYQYIRTNFAFVVIIGVGPTKQNFRFAFQP
jgi:hypothetical protein